jgi:hypothetical protein
VQPTERCADTTHHVGVSTTAVVGVTPILGAHSDTTAPVLTGPAVLPKRVKPAKLGRRAKAKIVFKLSEPASVRSDRHRPPGRRVRAVEREQAAAGGRYRLSAVATDEAHNAGARKTTTFTIRR